MRNHNNVSKIVSILKVYYQKFFILFVQSILFVFINLNYILAFLLLNNSILSSIKFVLWFLAPPRKLYYKQIICVYFVLHYQNSLQILKKKKNSMVNISKSI